jgi:hypothetical protein
MNGNSTLFTAAENWGGYIKYVLCDTEYAEPIKILVNGKLQNLHTCTPVPPVFTVLLGGPL